MTLNGEDFYPDSYPDQILFLSMKYKPGTDSEIIFLIGHPQAKILLTGGGKGVSQEVIH